MSGKYSSDQRPETREAGRLATTPDDDEEAWNRRATEHNWQILETIEEIMGSHPGSTHSQVALAWLLDQSSVASVILGVRTMEQLQDNLGASGLQLAQEELEKLGQISAPREGYPYRFLKQYGTRQSVHISEVL